MKGDDDRTVGRPLRTRAAAERMWSASLPLRARPRGITHSLDVVSALGDEGTQLTRGTTLGEEWGLRTLLD